MGFKKFAHSVNKNGKKFANGVVKRTDSVAKFTGNIIKQQSDNISAFANTLSNPLIMIGIICVGGYIALKVL